MRWKLTSARKGDERTVTRFLWLPKKIGREIRWLEKATWVERYVSFGQDDVAGVDVLGWLEMHWEDKYE